MRTLPGVGEGEWVIDGRALAPEIAQGDLGPRLLVALGSASEGFLGQSERRGNRRAGCGGSGSRVSGRGKGKGGRDQRAEPEPEPVGQKAAREGKRREENGVLGM